MKKIYILLIICILSIHGVFSQSISITTLSTTTYCAGATINIPFTTTGSFNTGNTFTAQLSDASGSFTSPSIIGTPSALTSGTINGVIPSTSTSGTNYKIRIKSSNPADTISNLVSITINALPLAAGTITGLATVCQGQSGVTYSIPAITNATSYTWTYSGIGASITSSTNSININFANNATSGNIIVKGNNTGCFGIASNLSITINPLPIINSSISGSVCSGVAQNYSITSTLNSGTTYNWSRAFVTGISNSAVTNQTASSISET